MAGTCSVCDSADREKIEQSLLESGSVEQVAEIYEVPEHELKMHALFHMVDPDCPMDSLARRIKLKEAAVLEEVSNEYLRTLKNMGKRINRLAAIGNSDAEEEDQQFRVSKMLTKPMVDLYVGIGGEIRQTVKTMAELDHMLNGPEDSTSSGLIALANAIRGSDSSHD